jgi:hypothetical protein
MKRTVALALAASLAATIAAGCAGATNPTGSPTPAPVPTLGPIGEPSLTPGTSGTPGPTLIPYPGPSIPPDTLTIDISAVFGLQFDRSSLSAPADTPFVIHFSNQDTSNGGRNHNVAIKLGGTLLFDPRPTVRTPDQADYFISEGLPASTYTFFCIVHPTMHGTLTIR